MESGGNRNYEVYKDQEKTEEAHALSKEEEEKRGHMKALENRVLDSQREMADLDNLEEIKAMNRRHIHLLKGAAGEGGGFDADIKALLDTIAAKKKKGDGADLDTAIELEDAAAINEEDEALIKSIQFGKAPHGNNNSKKKKIQRLGEEDERKLEQSRQEEIQRLEQRQKEAAQKAKDAAKKTILPIIKTKKRRQQPTPAVVQAKKKKVDAGIVRTGTIEHMVDNGQVSAMDIKVLNPRHTDNFPYLSRAEF